MALWFLFSLGDPESVAGEYGRHSLYKMLGYFSLVGLLRLHSLLGDYYQAIKVLENIELNKKVIRHVLTLLLQSPKCLCSNMLVKNCCTESSSRGTVCCSCQEFVAEHSWSFGIKSSHMIMPDAVAAQLPGFLGGLLCCARQCCYREYCWNC